MTNLRASERALMVHGLLARCLRPAIASLLSYCQAQEPKITNTSTRILSQMLQSCFRNRMVIFSMHFGLAASGAEVACRGWLALAQVSGDDGRADEPPWPHGTAGDIHWPAAAAA